MLVAANCVDHIPIPEGSSTPTAIHVTGAVDLPNGLSLVSADVAKEGLAAWRGGLPGAGGSVVAEVKDEVDQQAAGSLGNQRKASGESY